MSRQKSAGILEDSGQMIRIRRRRGLKTLRIAVASDGQVTVSAAKLVPLFLIKRFIVRQRDWIKAAQERFQAMGRVPRLSGEERRRRFVLHRDQAGRLVEARVRWYSEQHGFDPGPITIRDQRTRWGSCSARGALSFNYRIVFLPERLADYIVVHELCHLRELNHGPRFWRLLESILPDSELRREELRALSLLDAGHGDGL